MPAGVSVFHLFLSVVRARMKVTYPYIMAKVRIQTRKKGEETGHGTLPQPDHGSTHHPKKKDEGAIGILARIMRTEGFLGWYKVLFFSCLLFNLIG
jgi:Mitochondrial carrier protein